MPTRLYGAMIAQLRDLLDSIATANADDTTLAEIMSAMAAWTARLGPPAAETDAGAALRQPLPSRGRTMVPPFAIERETPDSVAGTVVFGPHFLGRNRSAHGGAIAMLFDEVGGCLVNRPSLPRARTAWLRVDYLQVTPIDRTLRVQAKITEHAGRKRTVEATLSSEEGVCAKASGLFVVLEPGQP